MADQTQSGSSSIRQPDYWWYRARTQLLQAALGDFLGTPRRLLDVGSADGPSVSWLHGNERFAVDLDPRGLTPGNGVCASALALPFRDGAFDVVGAFDVIEHCEPEARAIDELARVLIPGGLLLASVPAYQWAWSDHDVRAGHYRRYTRSRLVAAVEGGGSRSGAAPTASPASSRCSRPSGWRAGCGGVSPWPRPACLRSRGPRKSC